MEHRHVKKPRPRPIDLKQIRLCKMPDCMEALPPYWRWRSFYCAKHGRQFGPRPRGPDPEKERERIARYRRKRYRERRAEYKCIAFRCKNESVTIYCDFHRKRFNKWMRDRYKLKKKVEV